MARLYWELISSQMQQVMGTFGKSELGSRFYLAGGTALALQKGHRRSVDLDFFSETEDIPTLRERILQVLKRHQPVLVDQSWGNLLFLADSVQVGFYGYGYKLVEPTVRAADIQLASVADIGLMKLDALSGRASRKDFIDLYFICQEISLQQLLFAAPDKYPFVRDFEAQVVRQLAYFERAEQEEPFPLRQEVTWESVKDFFRQQAVDLSRRWLE